MRPKGWKLDPKWIAHYEAVEKARMERQIAVVKMEAHQMMMEMEDKFRARIIPFEQDLTLKTR